MDEIRPTEKFVAFIDVLGYSALTERAELGKDFSYRDLKEILDSLGTQDDCERIGSRMSGVCPEAPRVHPDLQFRLTQVWDSVVVSAEVSPAGIGNLIFHCFVACMKLLEKGVMCRGYIQKGKIYHEGYSVFGPGHVHAAANERKVSFMKSDLDEGAPPFIEIDPEVVRYVAEQTDACVKKMVDRMVITHDGISALYPIRRLTHEFILWSDGPLKFDADRERSNNDIMRSNIRDLIARVKLLVEGSKQKTLQQANHYVTALEEQLRACDRVDQAIDWCTADQPYGRIATPTDFPGLGWGE